MPPSKLNTMNLDSVGDRLLVELEPLSILLSL